MKQQIIFKTVHSDAFLSLTQWTVMKVTWWRSCINMNIYKLIQNSCKLLYLLSLAMKSCCFYGAKQLYNISTHSRAPSSICYSVQSMQRNSNWVSKSDKYYGSRICAQIVFFYFQLFLLFLLHTIMFVMALIAVLQFLFFSSSPPTFSTLSLWGKNKNKKTKHKYGSLFSFLNKHHSVPSPVIYTIRWKTVNLQINKVFCWCLTKQKKMEVKCTQTKCTNNCVQVFYTALL